MDGRDWKVQLAPGSRWQRGTAASSLLAQPEDDAQETLPRRGARGVQRGGGRAPGRPRAPARAQGGVPGVAGRGRRRAELRPARLDSATTSPRSWSATSSSRSAAASGKEVVSGRDVSTWVDRIVRAPFDALALTVPGAGDVDPRSDLGGGTVGAGGVVVTRPAAALRRRAGGTRPRRLRRRAPSRPLRLPRPLPRSPAMPAAAPAALAPSPSVHDAPGRTLPDSRAATLPTSPMEPPAPRSPEPVVRHSHGAFESFSLTDAARGGGRAAARRQRARRTRRTTRLQVQGIMCSRRHFNDPTAIYCSVCGISMVHQTHNLVSGKRPPLGVLVWTTAPSSPLNKDYVVGREPEGAPQAADGSARCSTCDDPELKVSRVHARIQLNGWNVRVVDAGLGERHVRREEGPDRVDPARARGADHHHARHAHRDGQPHDGVRLPPQVLSRRRAPVRRRVVVLLGRDLLHRRRGTRAVHDEEARDQDEERQDHPGRRGGTGRRTCRRRPRRASAGSRTPGPRSAPGRRRARWRAGAGRAARRSCRRTRLASWPVGGPPA